jgi:hypothetical protein
MAESGRHRLTKVEQLNHRCHQGLQIQDAIRLRPVRQLFHVSHHQHLFRLNRSLHSPDSVLTVPSFPINVNLEHNKETDAWEVEIRNFIGEKLVRRVNMRPGVFVEASKNVKDELQLSGNVRILAEPLVDGITNISTVPRRCLSECRRYPASLQSPQQGYPKVLGRSVRVGAGQHRGLNGHREHGFLSRHMSYEHLCIMSADGAWGPAQA